MGQQVGSDYISSYEGDQIDAILAKADSYPDPSTATDGQGPVFRDGKIEWEAPSGGGGEQAPLPYHAVTISAANWSGNTQTVAVPGILADETAQLIIPVPSSASRAVYESSGVKAIEQAADRLIFQALIAPTEDISVFIVIADVKEATA